MNSLRACALCAGCLALALLGTRALAGERPAPKGPVYLVVTGLRVDESGETPVVDPAPGEGAMVTLSPRGGTPQRKAVQPLSTRGKTYYTADFAIDFEATYDLSITFKGGPTLTVKDYRVSSEWTKVPIFTFNNTTGTKSPASVLRSERDPATKLGCYVYALWPYENYRAVGGKQLAEPGGGAAPK